MAFFLGPVLESHDRSRVEVFCYSDAAAPDRTTRRLQGLAEHWRPSAGLSDEALYRLIVEDRIDVLVDLAGHTAGNRLRVFAWRAAPVQVTWLGYPNTTGLETMDYRLTDGLCDPEGLTDSWYSESLCRLEAPFLCYGPPPEAPGPTRDAGARGPLLGSFNHASKISAPCLEAWAAILSRLPEARLLLRSPGLDDPLVRGRLLEGFRDRGIDPARLELDGRRLSVAEHLACYARVDLALDTFPYHGTTTTCEALWMGVPVLTLQGRTHVSRVGVSLLTQLGRSEWIATSPEDYVARAAALAGLGPREAEARVELRRQVAASPLCDAAGFARRLEACLLGLQPRRG